MMVDVMDLFHDNSSENIYALTTQQVLVALCVCFQAVRPPCLFIHSSIHPWDFVTTKSHERLEQFW